MNLNLILWLFSKTCVVKFELGAVFFNFILEICSLCLILSFLFVLPIQFITVKFIYTNIYKGGGFFVKFFLVLFFICLIKFVFLHYFYYCSEF